MLAPRFIALVLLLATAQAGFAEDTRLLRFPDIHEDRVVFVYAGDLYIASSNGGPYRITLLGRRSVRGQLDNRA